MTREQAAEIDAYIMKCPYFAGKYTIDRSNIGTHIGSCDLEFNYRKICPSPECLCAKELGLKDERGRVMDDFVKDKDDLISRQDAINAADRADYTGLAVEDVKKVTDEVVKELKKLPSAQQNRIARETAGKSPDEIYDFLHWLLIDYGRQFTDSRLAVIEWLRGERRE